MLEMTGTVPKREMEDQLLDTMDLERERGITIKAQSARLIYDAKDGKQYTLNLIDTPGHVDFNYEVSRSLAACEGALLIVDATQGVEAQTLANVYLALEHDLEIIPIINKVDLPSADPDRVCKEIEDVIGLDASDAIMISAKTGYGVDKVLEAIVQRIPAPADEGDKPLRALIFDSHFDAYKGAIANIRIMEGSIKPGQRIRMMASGKEFEVIETGVFLPQMHPVPSLECGSVGYLAASMKNVRDCRVGDTVTLADNPAKEALPGYRKAVPMVYCGLYPVETNDYDNLRDALEKLHLNDAALLFEPETSSALGFGFRCGFLGLLHMDVVRERLEREYNLSLITTAPSVIYHVYCTDGTMVEVDNPSQMPDMTKIDHIEEPLVKTTIIIPKDMVGTVMEISQNRRGQYVTMDYLDDTRVSLVYNLPLCEILYDYFDVLKSATRGYASLDYELNGYQASPMVKMDILINGDVVDALSVIVHKDFAARRGRALVEKLRSLIPRQLFQIPIQAAVGNKIIARENVAALRKDVLAKCYGGDISRKRKLLEKTEGRQEAHETVRHRRNPAGSLHGCPQSRRRMTLGLYVHIPFCRHKCLYCDFPSYAGLERYCDGYVQALCRDIAASPYAGEEADTIYIGGGTPSLLAAGEIGRILETLRRTFRIADDAEITMEANPDSLSYDKAAALADCGVNRLSLGVQSVFHAMLSFLGRVHTAPRGKGHPGGLRCRHPQPVPGPHVRPAGPDLDRCPLRRGAPVSAARRPRVHLQPHRRRRDTAQSRSGERGLAAAARRGDGSHGPDGPRRHAPLWFSSLRDFQLCQGPFRVAPQQQVLDL